MNTLPLAERTTYDPMLKGLHIYDMSSVIVIVLSGQHGNNREGSLEAC